MKRKKASTPTRSSTILWSDKDVKIIIIGDVFSSSFNSGIARLQRATATNYIVKTRTKWMKQFNTLHITDTFNICTFRIGFDRSQCMNASLFIYFIDVTLVLFNGCSLNSWFLLKTMRIKLFVGILFHQVN